MKKLIKIIVFTSIVCLLIYKNLEIILIFFLGYFYIKNLSIKENFEDIKKQYEFIISTIKHDLRISALSQVRALEILQKLDTDEKKEVWECLNYSCNYNLEMINILINLFSGNYNHDVIHYEKINIQKLIEKCIKDNEKNAKLKNLSIYVHINDSVNFIEADKIYIQEAFKIILSLVISYSYKNGNCKIIIDLESGDINFRILFQSKYFEKHNITRLFNYNYNYDSVGQGIRIKLFDRIIKLHNGNIMISEINDDNYLINFSIPQKRKIVFNNYDEMKRFFLIQSIK